MDYLYKQREKLKDAIVLMCFCFHFELF